MPPRRIWPSVALGFIFRHAEPNQRPNEPSHYTAGASAGQRGDNRPRGEEWTQAGNGQRTDTDQPTQRPSNHNAGTCAGRRSFRRLSALRESEILCPLVLGKQHGNIRIPEFRSPENIYRAFDSVAVAINSKCCYVLSCDVTNLLFVVDD
jgi:hypothetical protein